MVYAGMNGFGRFGLHLLKYWLDRSSHTNFRIVRINDDFLTLDRILEIIYTDRYVQIAKTYKISKCNNEVTFTNPNGEKNTVIFSMSPYKDCPWIGQTDIVLECSGKNTLKRDCQVYFKGMTKQVVISATSWDADQTVVYGFNHEKVSFQPGEVISYGSCTVNGYVPLADFIHQRFGIRNSDVNVIHNIQEYRLEDPSNHTLLRKFCTLERSGAALLGFLTPGKNFIVNYTVVPYTGVSMIDFRFALERVPCNVDEILSTLDRAVVDGPLQHLYGIDAVDRGPEVHKLTSFSAVIVRSGVRLLDGNLYLQGYFDNENSVNRYFDLVNFMAKSRLFA
ncbi:MAG: putative glyceraldehyde 3-phosphate dehydrogenase [Magnetococcales bacterium]|nr:putative glyceraldehyde 3-phosphate dehydrogenase [Magnetococcales bacterium]